MGEWREFDTTADTGIEVWANNPADLFATAGKAFTALTTDPESLTPDVRATVEVEANALDFQLREFLNELLFILETKYLLPIEFGSFEIGKGRVYCRAIFGVWKQGRNESRTEIKAVTYHMLKAKCQEDGVYYGRVVFDI
jgi:SHS2 domain-containing protein